MAGMKGVHSITGGSDTTFYTGIEQNQQTLPETFTLEQNFPNPFNPSTIIKYILQQKSFVRLEVYDITGKNIKTLISQQQNTGEYVIRFDAEDLSTGVYIYKIDVDTGKKKYSQSKKMILIR